MITDFPINTDNQFFGGLIKFKFIPVGDILTEPDIFENTLMGNYVPKIGKSILSGFFDRESAKFGFDDTSDNKGKLIKSAFTAEISDNSPAMDKLFCEMRCDRYIVWVIDNYKNVRVLGRKDAGAIFNFSFSTKDKVKNAPVYSFSFKAEHSCVLPFTATQIDDIC